MDSLNLTTRLMNVEVINLKDAIWSLTKRVKMLEMFILKQYGNVLDLDVIHGKSIADMIGNLPTPGTQKSQIPLPPSTRGRRDAGFGDPIPGDRDRDRDCSGAISDSDSPSYGSEATAMNTGSASASTTANSSRKRVPYADLLKETELKSKQCLAKANEFARFSYVEVKTALGFESIQTETEEAFPMNDIDNMAKINEKIKCPVCYLTFIDSVQIQDHMKTLHPNVNIPHEMDEQESNTQSKSMTHNNKGVKWEFILANRGGVTLCINDFIFRRQKTVNGKVYYYCCAPECQSTVQTRNDELILSTLKENHEHPNHKDEILDLKILQSIRKRAIDEPQVPIPVLFKEEKQRVVDTFGNAVAARMPSYESLSTTLYRDRGPTPKRPKKSYPPGCKIKSQSKKVSTRSYPPEHNPFDEHGIFQS